MIAQFYTLMRKDIVLELRSGRLLFEIGTLSLLILLVLLIAYGPEPTGRPGAAASALWVALVFAGLPATRLAIVADQENDCAKGLILSPVDPATVFVAKTASTTIFIAAGSVMMLLFLTLFFNLELSMKLIRLLPIILLGTVALGSVGTLVGTITAQMELGDVMLALLVAPLYVPALIAGITASIKVLNGDPLATCDVYLKVLAACDLLFVVCGCLLYEYLT